MADLSRQIVIARNELEQNWAVLAPHVKEIELISKGIDPAKVIKEFPPGHTLSLIQSIAMVCVAELVLREAEKTQQQLPEC